MYTYYKHNKNGKYSTVVKHLDIGERFNGFEAVLAKLSPRRYVKTAQASKSQCFF